jgi:tetratricopeptide (TPR) repeat protein
MAQKEFAQAQRRATEIQAELAAAPKLKAQFGPELEDLLHQAEARLRLQRFEKLADEGRFAANRSLGHSWTNEPRDEARRVCQEAVAVFHVLDSERWLQDLEGLPLERTDVTRIKQSLTEVLFLLAVLEGGPADASGKRRAIALLNQLETLAPNLHVLYEYRGRYRTSIGEQEAARGDRQRASTIPRSTWLDHYFAAKEQTRFRDALRELEAALTIRVEDYWSWYFWSYFEYRLGEPDRARWGLSICIGLRPEEACAWFQRGFTQTGADRMADFNRVLELTSDPVLRVLSYCEISMVRQSMGQLEAALADAETAVRLQPDSRFASLRRAHCYQALGQADGARADARRVLDLCNDPGGGFRHFWPRIDALLLLGEPQAVVDECLAFLKTEQLQDYVPGWARGNEAKPGFGFMMAMARWKLGQKEDARRWYDKAVERIDKSKPEDETLRRFHEEAAATLGIPDKRPVERPKTDKAKGEMRHGDTETKTE